MDKIQTAATTRLTTTVLDEISASGFVDYYLANKTEIEKVIATEGALKFKGVKIDSQDTFQFIIDAISERFLAYVDGNSPRTKLSGNVYTSTEYDQTQKITMHNELSYSAKWPNKLFFSCLQPSDTGGETLLADSRKILEEMNPAIVKSIEEKGVIYYRNLHGGDGMGPTWQDTFETDSRAEVENHCNNLSMEFEWVDDSMLRLKHKRDGIVKHRLTQEKVWFNQIDQFHPCHLGEDIFEIMEALYEEPGNFPMYVTYGDGKEIPEEVIKEVIETIDQVTIAPTWGKDELLIVDNELYSHGRNPYTGPRRVLVSMSM